MSHFEGGTNLRRIARAESAKAPARRITVDAAGDVALVTVHSCKPGTFESRRSPDLVPKLERALGRTVTVEVKAEAQAIHKYVRVSPNKARRIMDEVRGLYVDEALAILKFLPNRAARYVEKLIGSAAANAFEGFGADPDELKVALLKADAGPTWKRLQPRAMGRAYRVLKRTAHLTVAVAQVPKRAEKKLARRGRAAVVKA